jgi:hypothetical protein
LDIDGIAASPRLLAMTLYFILSPVGEGWGEVLLINLEYAADVDGFGFDEPV